MYSINTDNRLEISPEVAGDFTLALDEPGKAIAFSETRLIVFFDETGCSEYEIASERFRFLCGCFFVLDGYLHYLNDRLGRFDLGSMLGFGECYAWDMNQVYYLNGSVLDADPSSFTALAKWWAKDANTAYFQEQPIGGSDPKSFEVADGDIAFDANFVYGFLGERLAPFTTRPREIGRGYWAIGSEVFFGSQEVPDAHLATFEPLPRLEPKDKRRIWARGGPRSAREELAVSGFFAMDRARAYKGPHSRKR